MTNPAGFYKDYNYNFLTQNQVDAIDQSLPMPAGQNISQNIDTGSVIKYASVTLTPNQILHIRATPVTIVQAPGAGYAIQYLDALLALNYNNATPVAYTIANATDYLNFRYNNGTGVIVSDNITPTGFLDQTASTYTSSRAKVDGIVTSLAANNGSLVLHNSGAAEYTLGNSPITVKVAYIVHYVGF